MTYFGNPLVTVVETNCFPPINSGYSEAYSRNPAPNSQLTAYSLPLFICFQPIQESRKLLAIMTGFFGTVGTRVLLEVVSS